MIQERIRNGKNLLHFAEHLKFMSLNYRNGNYKGSSTASWKFRLILGWSARKKKDRWRNNQQEKRNRQGNSANYGGWMWFSDLLTPALIYWLRRRLLSDSGIALIIYSVFQKGKQLAKRLFGNIQVVDSFPDVTVQVVNSFADLHVKVILFLNIPERGWQPMFRNQEVSSFPDSPGKWKVAFRFPDWKVKFVTSFPDITIKWVSSFPGPQK